MVTEAGNQGHPQKRTKVDESAQCVAVLKNMAGLVESYTDDGKKPDSEMKE